MQKGLLKNYNKFTDQSNGRTEVDEWTKREPSRNKKSIIDYFVF